MKTCRMAWARTMTSTVACAADLSGPNFCRNHFLGAELTQAILTNLSGNSTSCTMVVKCHYRRFGFGLSGSE